MKRLVRHTWKEGETIPEGVIYADNDGYDGMLNYWGATTLDTYHRLKEEGRNVNHKEVFYAFSNEHFLDGLRRIGKVPGDGVNIYDYAKEIGIVSMGAGCYGTVNGIRAMLEAQEDINERIKNECDPQEVYLYENNNYESCINYEGDRDAILLVADIWGMDVAKNVSRFYAGYDLDTPAWKKLISRATKEAIGRDMIDMYCEPKEADKMLREEYNRNNHGVNYFENVVWCGWRKVSQPKLIHTWHENGIVLQLYRQVIWHKSYPVSCVEYYFTGNHYHSQGKKTISRDYIMEDRAFTDGIDKLQVSREWRNQLTRETLRANKAA